MSRFHNVTNNFSSGEFSPKTIGRTDLTEYRNGAQLMKNFLPFRNGGAGKRSGARFVVDLGDMEDPALLPFVASEELGYIVALDPTFSDAGKFVRIFHEDNFVITFGTEHNSPALIPLKVDTRGNIDLDDELKEISYQGACVIAAHQYLRAHGEEGYLDAEGKAKLDQIDEFRVLGAGVFNYYFKR